MPAALRLISPRTTPATWGEGYIAGHDEGYTAGRRDRGLELLIAGFSVGLLLGTTLLYLLIR